MAIVIKEILVKTTIGKDSAAGPAFSKEEIRKLKREIIRELDFSMEKRSKKRKER